MSTAQAFIIFMAFALIYFELRAIRKLIERDQRMRGVDEWQQSEKEFEKHRLNAEALDEAAKLNK